MEKWKERSEMLKAFINDKNYKDMKKKDIAILLSVPEEEMEELNAIFDELCKNGDIIYTKKKKIKPVDGKKLVKGIYLSIRSGNGFVSVSKEKKDKNDIFVKYENSRGALHGDEVVVCVDNIDFLGRKEGVVLNIVKRANETIVGTVMYQYKKYFIRPDNPKLNGVTYYLRTPNLKKDMTGCKVVAKITDYCVDETDDYNMLYYMYCEITEVLGKSDEKGIDVLSIIKSYGFSDVFSPEVEEELAKIPDRVRPPDFRGRKDIRDRKTVTIDGPDAKDLDDAVTISKKENGNFMLGVHIADVSHYVKKDSPLDMEARKRGTSVYFVDRVLPMLPPKLSNGICSLNAGVDRLAFSVDMEVDGQGNVVDHEIYKSVIHVDERMNYDDVYDILEGDVDLIKRYREFLPEFTEMKRLASVLNEKRERRGSVNFDFPESKIKLDNNGMAVSVDKIELNYAHNIIEEFMILCNETVAERFFWLQTPFMYRTHDKPSSEKIENFDNILRVFGLKLKGKNEIHPKVYQEISNAIKGRKEERLLNMVMLRSMQKAKYHEENLGHFGLASSYYCHFTSPIRRYPDLTIHRIMKAHIEGKLKGKLLKDFTNNMHELAVLCSEREKAADDAERDAEDMKKVEYMKQFEGQSFKGIISNIISSGMFVELDNTVEGFVRVDYMFGDYYEYDERNYSFSGEITGDVYKIGDAVTVRLDSANVYDRKIDFTLIRKVKEKPVNKEDQKLKNRAVKKEEEPENKIKEESAKKLKKNKTVKKTVKRPVNGKREKPGKKF